MPVRILKAPHSYSLFIEIGPHLKKCPSSSSSLTRFPISDVRLSWGLHPAAGIWLIGLHSAPLFDIDLIIIAFFPEPPLPSAVLSYPADKSWVVLGLLQNWQELNPLNTNNTQIHTHKYINTGTNTHIQIQKVGIWYLPSAQSVV